MSLQNIQIIIYMQNPDTPTTKHIGRVTTTFALYESLTETSNILAHTRPPKASYLQRHRSHREGTQFAEVAMAQAHQRQHRKNYHSYKRF